MHPRTRTGVVQHASPTAHHAAQISRRYASFGYGSLADSVGQKTEAHTEPIPREDVTTVSTLEAKSSSANSLGIGVDVVRRYPELQLGKFFSKLSSFKRRLNNDYYSLREKKSSAALKDLMRSMPHSTALITTLASEPIYGDNSLRTAVNLSPYSRHFRGAIVSSLTSVTLGPPAIVTFNFKEPSATLDGIRANRFFTVHFLYSNEHGASVASRFLQRPGDHHAAWKALSVDHEITVSKQLNFANPEMAQPKVKQRAVAPVINGPGVAAHITCEILPDKCISGIGDHSIIVAKVVHGMDVAKANPRYQRDRLHDASPPLLLYSEGHFREHGRLLETSTKTEQSSGAAQVQVAMHQDPTKTHKDLLDRKRLVVAGEPELYRATTAYIESVLTHPWAQKHSNELQNLIKYMYSASDRRARFVIALKLWQLDRRAGNGESEVDLAMLQIPQRFLSASEQTLYVEHDERLREVAEELVKVSLDVVKGDNRDQSAASRSRQRRKVVETRDSSPPIPRPVAHQDRTVSRETSSETLTFKITRTPSRVPEGPRQAVTKLRGNRSTTKPGAKAQPELQSESEGRNGVHASAGDAPRQHELELEKHETSQDEVGDDKVKPEVILPGPLHSEFHV